MQYPYFLYLAETSTWSHPPSYSIAIRRWGCNVSCQMCMAGVCLRTSLLFAMNQYLLYPADCLLIEVFEGPDTTNILYLKLHVDELSLISLLVQFKAQLCNHLEIIFGMVSKQLQLSVMYLQLCVCILG